MTKRIVSAAIIAATGAIVFASTNEAQVKKLVDGNPGLKLEDRIIDTTALLAQAEPILAQLDPLTRAAVAAVGVNQVPQSLPAAPLLDAAEPAKAGEDAAPSKGSKRA